MKFEGRSDHPDRRSMRFRGNHQKLNHDELQEKAKELEILFAEHKLRGNAADQFKYVPAMKVVRNYEFHDEAFGQTCIAVRGEFYERYVKRRDAKLRREWEWKRAEKEAELEDLRYRFDRLAAELQAKLYGTSARQSSMGAHRSFKSHSSIKWEQKPPANLLHQKEDRDFICYLDHKPRGCNRLLDRSLSFSTSTYDSAPQRHRHQSTLLVPRKENAEQSYGVSCRSRGMSFPRSKGASQGAPIAQREKPLTSQSLSKSSGVVSEAAVNTHRKFCIEQTKQDKSTSYGKSRKQDDSMTSTCLGNKKGEEDDEVYASAVEDCAAMKNGSQDSERSANSGSENGDDPLRCLHVSNPSHVQLQPHKDLDKGFKRLLKLGRRTQDGENNLEVRSSGDLMELRMGCSPNNLFDNQLNKRNLLNGKVQGLRSHSAASSANFKPREDHNHRSAATLKGQPSFFSLSSFRSKPSDSRLKCRG